MEEKIVRDWMTPNPMTATPDMSLIEAYRVLKLHHIRRLPVIKDNQLVGIVTLSDIRKFLPLGLVGTQRFAEILREAEVELVMTDDVITIPVEAPVTHAAKLLLKHKVGGIPVVKEMDGIDRLVGIISESDLFRMILDQMPFG